MSKFSVLRWVRGGSAQFGVLLGAVAAIAVVTAPSDASAQRRAAAMAIDANTGEVLHALAADEPRFPASLTKMMTLYIAFGEIEAGRLSTTSRIRISEAAASVPPSKLDLSPGSEITLGDAMKALVTKSANDVAVAVAERISGSEAAFARLMTERARQIGMRATTFRNAHGLPHPEQITTARDMLTLALRLQDDYPKHYRIFSLKYFTHAGDTHRNHNTLLFHFQGAEGIKTGYTRLSGFNLVSSVKRDGKHVVAAVFGGETAGTRNAHMRNILSRALAKASTVKTRKAIPMLVASPKAAPRPAKVAKADPPPRPAHVRKAERPAQATPPAQAAKAQADEEPLQKVSVPPPARPAAQPEPAIPQPFEVAMVKVRPAEPVVTGPLPVKATPAATMPVHAAASPKLDFSAVRQALSREIAPEASAPPAPRETIVAKQPGTARAPGTLAEQMAILESAPYSTPQAAPAPATAPARESARAAELAQAAPARGLPPSTLNAQAARLAGDAHRPMALPARLGGPADATYEIEIGTFASAEEAEARLAAVQSKTASVAGHAPMALPVEHGGRQAYRARFAGFDEHKAAGTCLELRRAAIDCQVAAP